jgi:pyridoxamine 5'-phosphate oxidase
MLLLTDPLPDPLPPEPLRVAAEWLADARRRRDQPNPDAMVLATVGEGGAPSARVVLCKEIDPAAGCLRFVSNYHSRKGRELEANPRAAVVMHWDAVRRQLRIEGTVTRADAAASDAYFAGRPRESQLGAHASLQSEPIASRAALEERLAAVAARFPRGTPVPRPAHWGVYELRADAVELWVEGSARLHDRARYVRTASGWAVTRLQP